jgi:hypothetical protein
VSSPSRPAQARPGGLDETENDDLRVLMVRLARKLGPGPSGPRHVRTETGTGCRFEP